MSLPSFLQFRRSGQRDERRRRLLADESCTLAEAGGSPAVGSAPARLLTPRKSPNYGDAAFMDEQPRLTDLIPRRLTTFALLLVAALGVVAGLEALYAWSCTPAISRLTTDGKVAAFDLDEEGSLGTWFSSTTLMLASFVAALVYTIRRHKTDDYRGYYRIWLWAALCWLVMSIDETGSVHEGFMGMMTAVTGTPIYGDGSIWWVVPYFFLLGAIGTRLLVDMHHCRLSSAALLTTAGCYGLAVCTQILGDGSTRSVMLEEGAEMVGDVFVLLTMGLHARYVILDAEGLLSAREPKSSRSNLPQPAGEAATAAADRLSVDAPHPTPRPVLGRRTRADEPEPEPIPGPVRRKLTKQEKKVLRQRLMEQRLNRGRQQRHGW